VAHTRGPALSTTADRLTSSTDSLAGSARADGVIKDVDIPDEPPREIWYKHKVHMRRCLVQMWQRREMIYTLAERDIRASFKQAVLGISWALITPVASLIIFTFIFGRVKAFHVPGVPYPIYAYTGLVCWGFFSNSFTSGGNSMIGNMALLQKTHFPRECFPLSQMVEASFYSAITVIPLLILFLIYGYAPHIEVLWSPIFILIEVVFTAGAILIMSACIVYLRDLIQVMGIMVQFGLFLTPVIWPFDKIPTNLQPLYSFLNPLGPVINNLRITMLQGKEPTWGLLGIAFASALTYASVGYWTFKRLETQFADIS
jgi:ABC-type polysaccharide/polyol phosphate export permease